MIEIYKVINQFIKNKEKLLLNTEIYYYVLFF